MDILKVLAILAAYSVALIFGVRWFIATQMEKVKINRIHDFIQSKINELEAKLSEKFDQVDEVSINLRVDLQHYQRLKEDFDVFSDQVQVKKSSMEDVFKRQSKLFEKGEREASKFEKILSDIQFLDKEIKKSIQEINNREKKVSQVIQRINTWEATLYQQLQKKVDKFAKHYDEIMDGRINSLQKWLDGSEQKINGINKKFVDLGEMNYLSLKERYDDIEVEIKDRLDDIMQEEKLRLEEDLKLIGGEMRTQLQTFNADLSREQDKQQDLINQKELIEKDLVTHKETLKVKMDDLAETILSGFKEKVGDYQDEIVEELEKKFGSLNGQIKNWDDYLREKESEIVDKIDLKFTSITDSFDKYRTVVDEESQKLVLTQKSLEKEFIQIHEEKLTELLFKIDTMKEAMKIIEAKNEERGMTLKNLYSFIDESKEMVTYKLDNFVTHLDMNKDESTSIIQAYAEGIEEEKESTKVKFKELFEREFKSNVEQVKQKYEKRYVPMLDEIILKTKTEAKEKVVELEANLKVKEVNQDKLASQFEERIKEVEVVTNQIQELKHIDVDDIVNTKVSHTVEEKVQVEIDERFGLKIKNMMNLVQEEIENLKKEKQDNFNLIEEVVAEFQDKVMLKKAQIEALDEKENEYLNLLKEKKSSLIDQSEEFYLTLEKETEKKAHLYLDEINTRLSNEMEIKKQDWEILLVEYLENQKAGLREYQLLMRNELRESLGTQLEQIRESIDKNYEEIRSQIYSDLERDGDFLKKELLELERHLKQHDSVVKDLDQRNENFKSLEHKQRDYLEKIQSLIKENQERFKKYFNEQGFSNKFLKELKKDFSVDFLKKELSKEFDGYRKNLIIYTEKWKKLFKELDEGKQIIKKVKIEGDAEFKQLIKKSQHQMIDQENKTRAKFNDTVKFIESEMKGVASQIKQLFKKSETIEKMYILHQDFESSVKKYESYLKSFKKYETDFETLQIEIEEIKAQDQQLKGLYQELEQKEIMVGQVEKKLVQVIDLSTEADKRISRIENTSKDLTTLADSIDNYRSELSDAQSQMNKVVAFKSNFIEIKTLIDSLEQNVVVAKSQNEILVEKINAETNQQETLNVRLNELEDKSILLENKYKVIDDFSDKYSQLDIAILDIEERTKSIDKLKKDLTSEQSKMIELRDMFNHQIGLSLNLAKDKSDQKLVSQYPKIVKTLKDLGWTEIQISKHLDLDLAQIKLILKNK